MNTYSQNGEDLIMQKYFEGKTGSILSLGENDGHVLSNAKALIEQGWAACLVEPSPVPFANLVDLHAGNPRVKCFNYAISDYCGMADFFDSGTHLNVGDTGLLSSLSSEEIEKWEESTEFTPIKVRVIDVPTLMGLLPYGIFDAVSIDCEGEDLKILSQLKLREMGTRLIIVEWNSRNFAAYDKIITEQGLYLLEKNPENLIYIK